MFDRVAPPPFPHGPPPLAPPPFPGEGLGPIVRLPNGLYGFDHLAHSDPRLAAERVPPPWERESSDRGHLNRGLPEFRRSLSRERGPLAYEGGRGDSHRLERDARHARNDGRGRSTERSPREWGRTPRGGHTGDEARRWNLEPRRSKSPQVGGERGFERERGASGRIGRVGDRRNLSPTWRNRESPSPRDRNVGAEVRKEAEKPSSEARESGGGETRFTSRLVKKEVGGRLVFEESVQRSVEERGRPQAREGREAKDRAWGTQSSKENSKRSREREERQGRGSETKREQKRGGPESSEQRVSSGGRSEQGSKGRNGVQAKYRKDEVTRGDGKADPRREAPGESNKERGNQPSSRIEEEGGPPGKGLTLVEAIRREQLKSGLVSAKHDFRKQTMSTDGGSIPNREDQGSGGEQQRTGRVASESGSGVVQSGPSPDRQEQPKPSVLTLFSQILDPGSPRQELNLLENLGARSSEERTGCLPSLAQTSLCLHVGMKVGSPKWEEGPLIATAEISASLNEPEPPGVVETFEAIFQPATQKVPPFSFLNLKQPLPDSLNQPRELVDKETQTSSAHFASPSVAKQLHALQAHPLYWLCFEEMPAKDLKRADWAADFRLGWGGGESDKVATRDGLGRGLDMGGVVADRVSVDQDAPPAERVIERGEPRTGVEAGGSESGEPSAPVSWARVVRLVFTVGPAINNKQQCVGSPAKRSSSALGESRVQARTQLDGFQRRKVTLLFVDFPDRL